MNSTRSIGLISILLAASIVAEAGPPQSPTFEQRIEAQRAIERVYFSHLVGQTRTFDEAVPAALIENKVRTYLEQSAALRDVWHTEITPDALRRELERIAAATRMADRLSEIYAALGNDALLIEECFARPVLVDRLARNFQAGDGILHQRARAEAEALRARLTDGSLDPTENHPRRFEVVVTERTADADPLQTSVDRDPGRRDLDTEAFKQWRSHMPSKVGEVGAIIEESDHLSFAVLLSDEPGSARVASYIVPKVAWDTWWQTERQRWRAEEYKPADRVELPPPPPLPSNARQSADTIAGQASGTSSCKLSPFWSNGILDNLPLGREGHSAVWTGSHMIIWGGYHEDFGVLTTGSRYDPVIDTWSPISTISAPIARYLHTATWTGSVMVVWGGYGKPPKGAPLSSGGLYNPVTDTWQTVNGSNAPTPRYLHTAVWTGRHMIIWGGVNAKGQLGSGGKYDPVRNTWSTVSTNRAPTRRVDHTAVWTGTRMIVWGGFADRVFLNTGASYDPLTNSWTELPVAGAPTSRAIHTAVWTGVEMIVWGGAHGFEEYVATGGRYNPITNTWIATATQNAPKGRGEHLSVWTGSEMIVWGGHANQDRVEYGNGGRYDPSTDTWTAMTNVDAPALRYAPSAIWTGERLVVWGGSSLNTGGRYDPRTDSWTPTSTLNAPTVVRDHSAFWTGTMMLVWGGYDLLNPAYSGGRYDPLTDAWTHLPTVDAPGQRDGSILWTGTHMVLWGGQSQFGNYYLNTGAFYEPISDVWQPMTLNDAPSPRTAHAMVWTGDKLLVWGGYGGTSSFLGDGGRYDFATNTWSPITMAGAPSARSSPIGVWTGSQMIVWNGVNSSGQYAATGARYDPAADRWYPISWLNAPTGRLDGSVVWTGQELLLWGGRSNAGINNFGARYDPVTDRWRSTSTIGAPSGRIAHTTVWTGRALLVWGGVDYQLTFNTGGVYDPVSDTWKPMTLTGAPSPRRDGTAVWTGRLMIIWGGRQVDNSYQTWFATGGAYDPVTNSWQKTSLSGVPSPRSGHTAVWTGREMIVYGGGVGLSENSGGRLAIYDDGDIDGDGFSACVGDCDEARATVHPGATQICGDKLNNDCSMGLWPSLVGTNEVDDDGDLVTECAGDCNDADAAVRPGKPEVCDLIDNNCDGATDEGFDQDHDSVTTCGGDCDDTRATIYPAASQTCDGFNNDCSGQTWPSIVLTNENDEDGDGMTECDGDCDDTSAIRYPGAPEINDGQDEQCPGDQGFGAPDEVASDAVFVDGAGTPAFCWSAQQGALGYLVTRADNSRFSKGCHRYYTTSTCHEDSQVPAPRRSFYYLVRAEDPMTGSWGQTSEGLERAGLCPEEVSTFTFVDSGMDDISPTSLQEFFMGVGPKPSDYIFFEIRTGGAGGTWCSEHADFYRDSYLGYAGTSGTVSSGSWTRWARSSPAFPWSLEAGGSENKYGLTCHGTWSWCWEWSFGSSLTIQPGREDVCEASIENVGCGDGTWTFTIRIAPTREAACGF